MQRTSVPGLMAQRHVEQRTQSLQDSLVKATVPAKAADVTSEISLEEEVTRITRVVAGIDARSASVQQALAAARDTSTQIEALQGAQPSAALRCALGGEAALGLADQGHEENRLLAHLRKHARGGADASAIGGKRLCV